MDRSAAERLLLAIFGNEEAIEAEPDYRTLPDEPKTLEDLGLTLEDIVGLPE